MGKCTLHESESVLGVCLNEAISEAYFCGSCLTSKHSDCPGAIHLSLEQLGEFLAKEGTFEGLREDLEAELSAVQKARDSVARSGEQVLSDLEKRLENQPEIKHAEGGDGFKFVCENRNALSLTRREDNSILVTDGAFGDPDDLEFELGHFEAKLDQTVSEIFRKVYVANFPGSKRLSKEQFLIHPNYSFKVAERKVVLELPKSTQFKSDYFLVLLKEPLTTDLKWKITVDKVSKSDRYLEIGLIDQAKFNSAQTSLKSSFLFGPMCFCGYNFKGMTGPNATNSLSSEDGLEDGTVFYISYTVNTKIFNFWSDMKKYNLSGVFKGGDKPYLYLCSFYQEETVTIEVLV